MQTSDNLLCQPCVPTIKIVIRLNIFYIQTELLRRYYPNPNLIYRPPICSHHLSKKQARSCRPVLCFLISNTTNPPRSTSSFGVSVSARHVSRFPSGIKYKTKLSETEFGKWGQNNKDRRWLESIASLPPDRFCTGLFVSWLAELWIIYVIRNLQTIKRKSGPPSIFSRDGGNLPWVSRAH